MNINSLLDKINLNLRNAFPSLAMAAKCSGTFGIEELKKFSILTPAMFTTCLGAEISDPYHDSIRDAELGFRIYVVTKSSRALDRDETARDLVEGLLLLIPKTRWDMAGTGNARETKAENLNISDFTGTGISLWSVSWKQKIRLADENLTGAAPEHVFASFVPKVGTAHINDYFEVP